MRRRGSLRLRIAGVVGASMLAALTIAAVVLHDFVEGRLVATAEDQAREGLFNAGLALGTGATPLQVMFRQVGPPGNVYIQVLANGQRLALPTVADVDGAVVPGEGASDGHFRVPLDGADAGGCGDVMAGSSTMIDTQVGVGQVGESGPITSGGDVTAPIDVDGDGWPDEPFSAIAPLPDEAIAGQFVRIDDADIVMERTEVCGVPMMTASLLRTDVGGDSTITLLAATSLAETERTLATLRTTSWFAVPLVALGLALLAWYLVGRSLRPVDRMRDEADRISHGTLHRRLSVPAGSVDELGRLGGTMNAMLDRLEGAQRRQRQFVSDASHELRSPLATARAILEVDASAEARTAAIAQVDRISALVDDLLALARLDEIGPGAVEVDLDEIVLDEAAVPRDHDVTIDLRGVGPARIVADPFSVRRLVRNLVDNACRHASSRVELTVAVDDRDPAPVATLIVDDDGPGIAPDERTRVFERFARLDEGRARDDGGVGIGLALVRSVALAHGGDVHIEDAPIGGARLVVRLPMAATPETVTG